MTPSETNDWRTVADELARGRTAAAAKHLLAMREAGRAPPADDIVTWLRQEAGASPHFSPRG